MRVNFISCDLDSWSDNLTQSQHADSITAVIAADSNASKQQY